MKLNTLGIAHKIIEEKVCRGNFCIDATAGRGHDTAFLCGLVGDEGRVLAMDIQQDAVDSTRALLQEKGMTKLHRWFWTATAISTATPSRRRWIALPLISVIFPVGTTTSSPRQPPVSRRLKKG